MPDFATAGADGTLLYQMAPAALVPYGIFYFLELVHDWKSGAFHRMAGHVLQATVRGSGHSGLAFQEYVGHHTASPPTPSMRPPPATIHSPPATTTFDPPPMTHPPSTVPYLREGTTPIGPMSSTRLATRAGRAAPRSTYPSWTTRATTGQARSTKARRRPTHASARSSAPKASEWYVANALGMARGWQCGRKCGWKCARNSDATRRSCH